MALPLYPPAPPPPPPPPMPPPPQERSHIIYCSDGFCHLTGFSRGEVVQRRAECEFLHGPQTSLHAVAVVHDALIRGVDRHFEILYYKKDGN